MEEVEQALHLWAWSLAPCCSSGEEHLRDKDSIATPVKDSSPRAELKVIPWPSLLQMDELEPGHLLELG